jgi:hypothetical protein
MPLSQIRTPPAGANGVATVSGDAPTPADQVGGNVPQITSHACHQEPALPRFCGGYRNGVSRAGLATMPPTISMVALLSGGYRNDGRPTGASETAVPGSAGAPNLRRASLALLRQIEVTAM